MKRFGLYLTGLLLSVLCLTSCLKGSNVQEGWACGVLGVSKDMFTPVLKTQMGDFAASSLTSSLNKGEIYYGDCFLFYFRLDSDLPENAAKVFEMNGYYTITILQIDQIQKFYLNPGMTDIMTARPGEVPVTDGYYSGEYIDKYLFITQVVNQPSDLELYWFMNYDEQNMMVEENNKRYYDLYIRATIKRESDKTVKTDVAYLNAYDMQNYFQTAASMEKTYLGSSYNASSSKFTVRFNYVTSIDEETGDITWKSITEEIDIAWFTSGN